MKVGTKSLLFGVHQFLIHPLVVALAWRKYYGRWPQDKAEWVSIIVHDWGYWGCDDMDGATGRDHPLRGCEIAWDILKSDRAARQKAATLCLGHSSNFAMSRGEPVSDLYAPDKLSILFEPRWFYLLRGFASGEIWEYLDRAPKIARAGEWMHQLSCPAYTGAVRPMSPWKWINWYREKMRKKFYEVQD